MNFTLDASVHLNALNPREQGSEISQRLLVQLHQGSESEGPRSPTHVFSPTLLLVEVAAAAARTLDDAPAARALARAVRELPAQTWVELGTELAEEAGELGAQHRLRGADAIYCAVARRHDAVLVSLDRQQLERMTHGIDVCRPDEALQRLKSASS